MRETVALEYVRHVWEYLRRGMTSKPLCRSFLRTLDARNISNGTAEMLKMASVKDAPLFDLLEQYAEQLRISNFQVGAAGSHIFHVVSFCTGTCM